MFPKEHQDKFLRLKELFVSTLPAREAEIDEMVNQLVENGPSRKIFEELFFTAHKIAGIAPTYGMASLGQRAEQAEVLIDRARRSRPDDDAFYQILAATDELTEELRMATGNPIV